MNERRQTEMPTWRRERSAVFLRARDRHGLLGNMAGGLPVHVNGLTFQSSEGLYQALKCPTDARAQQLIAAAQNGYDAKRTAYRETPEDTVLANWAEVREDAMAFALAAKLSQNARRFAAALMETGDLDIVEMSSRDAIWGAARRPDGSLTGHNRLGVLLTELRDELKQLADARRAADALLACRDLSGFRILGGPVASPHL